MTPARSGAVTAALLLCAALVAAQERITEYQVKAAYLYNFSKFVKWPKSPSGDSPTFSICVLGNDSLARTLAATVAGEKLEGKSITARSIIRAADAAGCAIVYVGTSEKGNLSGLLPALAKHGPLTVSDIPRFADRGGMIGFIREGDRVRFEVNLDAAQSAGLVLSSELLKVASHVRSDGARGEHR